MKPIKKLLIIGYGQCGKDTVAEILRDDLGITFKSSSKMASEIFIFAMLKDKYGYKTELECYEDRRNHRQEWYELICEYNRVDPARLAKKIMEVNDAYIGMRSRREIVECMRVGLFDHRVWVNALDRGIQCESSASCDISWVDSDSTINNNRSKYYLRVEVAKWAVKHKVGKRPLLNYCKIIAWRILCTVSFCFIAALIIHILHMVITR